MNKATTTTVTTTSNPERWQRAQTKRVREEQERPKKAAREKEFKAKLAKMDEDSVKKKMQGVR